jgi:hypothetical protein
MRLTSVRTVPAGANYRKQFSRVLHALLLLIASSGIGVAASAVQTDLLDPRALPLGDGKVSAEPRRGYVYSCATQFRGGGAQHAGDWIRGSTWDATKKIQVRGDIAWPNATFTIATVNGERRVTGNGLPVNHTTGIFPVRRDDPAFQIDRNPNAIATQQVDFLLPLAPVAAARAGCVPMGVIGVALSGVAIFNALDDGGRDAVAHEVQDRCNGHPERQGKYHYHGPSSCIPGATANSTLIGYALDGFGIFSSYDANGRELTNADLDECHGRVGRIVWNGKETDMYHYVLTREYPYTVGCFHGAPVRMQQSRFDGGAPPGKGPRGPRQPPPEARAACDGLADGAQCRFTSPRGDAVQGVCRSPAGELACVLGMR